MYCYIFFCIFFIATVFSQIRSGPMLGYSEMREVLIWLQTQRESTIHIVYWEKGAPNKTYQTIPAHSKREEGYTAKLIADEVEPGRKYEYQVVIDGKTLLLGYPTEFQTQELWQWRKEPPEIKFLVGSCLYINEKEYDRPQKTYGRNYQIISEMARRRPDFMIWLGDNTYLREADWNSMTGIIKRYTHTRSMKELQPLLASTHHYATWDDHEYGPNDADRSFTHKDKTTKAFSLFWGNPNNGARSDGGIYTKFTWGDVDIFLLDNRTFRAPNRRKTERTYFGKKQLEWLIDGLSYSKAPFKLVGTGGQILNPLKIFENYANYEEERKMLFDLLKKERVEGVLFLSGDIHRAEVNKMEREGAYPIYDITTSPLTAKSYKNDFYKENHMFVEGSSVFDNNFAEITVSGKRKERVLQVKLIDAKGNEKYKLKISQEELAYPKKEEN